MRDINQLMKEANEMNHRLQREANARNVAIQKAQNWNNNESQKVSHNPEYQPQYKSYEDFMEKV